MSIRRGFVRCLWGIPSGTYPRNYKVITWDLDFIKYNLFDQPFTTYVFGRSNYELLKKHNIENCKLVSEDVSLWGWKLVKGRKKVNQYGLKLKVLELASNDFDEFIFLDWDCMALKSLPENFWESFYDKQPIQCHLRYYGRKLIGGRGAIWRDRGRNLMPCASFIYVRGKEIAQRLYNMWSENKKMFEERVLAMVMDDIMQGWKGVDKYWDMFEPDYFMLFRNEVRKQCYSKDLIRKKIPIFMHIHRHITIPYLKCLEGMPSIDERKKYITNKTGELFDKFIEGAQK